jgi:hypothetical protein
MDVQKQNFLKLNFNFQKRVFKKNEYSFSFAQSFIIIKLPNILSLESSGVRGQNSAVTTLNNIHYQQERFCPRQFLVLFVVKKYKEENKIPKKQISLKWQIQNLLKI